jgi:hypothetical protein
MGKKGIFTTRFARACYIAVVFLKKDYVPFCFMPKGKLVTKIKKGA